MNQPLMQAQYGLWARLAAYALIALSGASCLIYEITWQKYFVRLLGSDNAATATVLSTFLGGLSLGYLLIGRLSAAKVGHLRLTAGLEAVIGLWGLAFPYVFKWVQDFSASFSFAPGLALIGQGVFCAALLTLVSTFCMGGTLPLLTRALSPSLMQSHRVHARLYGLNTLGAFAGALAAGFCLIPNLGLPGSLRLASLLNFGAALGFLLLSLKKEPEWSQPQLAKPALERNAHPEAWRMRLLYLVSFLVGVCSMSLESVLVRLTNLSLGSSVYSFTMIVAAFILALALGGFISSWLDTRSRDPLPGCLGLAALSLLGLYLSLDLWPYYAHRLRLFFGFGADDFWRYNASAFLCILGLVLVPAGLIGASVPLIFNELKRDLEHVGRHSGLVFSFNTLGNLIGGLIGGILLFYYLDLAGVFLSAMFLAGLAACLAGLAVRGRWPLTWAVFCLLVLAVIPAGPFFSRERFMVGTYRLNLPQPFSHDGAAKFYQGFLEGISPLLLKDGPDCSVAVVETPEEAWHPGRPLSIMINGKSDSSTVGDAYTIKLAAHLPALLAENPRKCLVVGLGTGVTAAELLQYPEVERVDVAEISPSVISALPYFGDFTQDVHKNPRLRIHQADALRLLAHGEEKWDIIVSEPSNPWVAGMDSLFSLEFHSLVKKRLTPEGLFLQWIHVYDSDSAMLGMVMSTLSRVFPQVRVFMSQSNDLLLMASERVIGPKDVARASARLEGNPAAANSLALLELSRLDAILLREIWTPGYVNENFRNHPVQTLDEPKLGYMGARCLFSGRRVPPGYMLGNQTADFLPQYLLTALYPDWSELKLRRMDFIPLLLSTRDYTRGDNVYLPQNLALKLKAYLNDKARYPLTAEEIALSGANLVPAIAGREDLETLWPELGLGQAGFQERAMRLISQVEAARNWIAPYPIDGLNGFLKTALKSSDPADAAWAAEKLKELN